MLAHRIREHSIQHNIIYALNNTLNMKYYNKLLDQRQVFAKLLCVCVCVRAMDVIFQSSQAIN